MILPSPYFERDGITIFHADWREVVPSIPPVGILLTDPPYGIGYESHHNSGRDSSGEWKAWIRDENFQPIHGDDKPFQPGELLGALQVRNGQKIPAIILWGANHYASRLPDSPAWIWWDKLGDMGSCDQADGEIAWTNLPGPARKITHEWRGLIRRGEENVAKAHKLHPNQKPVRLMRLCIEKADREGVILDPFMGSGTTLVAARDMGRKGVGIDIEEWCCEVAAKRLEQGILFPLGDPE